MFLVGHVDNAWADGGRTIEVLGLDDGALGEDEAHGGVAVWEEGGAPMG